MPHNRPALRSCGLNAVTVGILSVVSLQYLVQSLYSNVLCSAYGLQKPMISCVTSANGLHKSHCHLQYKHVYIVMAISDGWAINLDGRDKTYWRIIICFGKITDWLSPTMKRYGIRSYALAMIRNLLVKRLEQRKLYQSSLRIRSSLNNSGCVNKHNGRE